MVAVGDVTGALGVWLPSVGYKETLGRHCIFKVHAGTINKVTFDRFHLGSVITSGEDGHMRQVFLAPEQSVDLIYRRWSMDHERVDFHLQLSAKNFLISKLDDNGATYTV